LEISDCHSLASSTIAADSMLDGMANEKYQISNVK